jgi:uncharacterized protein (DUF1810 family)
VAARPGIDCASAEAADPEAVARADASDLAVTSAETHDLERFVEAQDRVYARVIAELRAGRKASHWMWFVFPQIAGLGSSPMAQRYAISGREEAAAYAAHPVLGARLRECTGLVNAVEGRTAHQIFGSPDDMKFRSSMTLFARCAAAPQPFEDALAKYFAGDPDPLTLARL